MLLYRNHTRFPAIVTIKLEGGIDIEAILGVGGDKVLDEIKVVGSYHDILVGPFKELHVLNEASASIISTKHVP